MKQRFKKMLSIGLAITIAGTLAVGCGSNTGQKENTGNAGDAGSAGDISDSGEVTENTESAAVTEEESWDEPVTLTYWAFNNVEEAIRRFEGQWNEQNPDRPIVVDLQVYPFEDMHSKLLIALNSGQGAPDMAEIEIGKIGNFLKGTEDEIMLEPIDDLVEKYKDELLMSKFENYAAAGHYYGVDGQVGAAVAYYNPELLESAGIDYHDIKTYEDVENYGKILKEKTGKPFIMWDVSDVWALYTLITQAGGDWFDADGNVVMDSEINIKTVTWMQNLLKEGIAIVAPGGANCSEEGYAYFGGGNCGAVYHPLWWGGFLKQSVSDIQGKFRISTLPMWSEDGYTSTGMGGTCHCVLKTSDKTELAKEFLEFTYMTYESNLYYGSQGMTDPLRPDVYEELSKSENSVPMEYYGEDFYDVVNRALASMPGLHITSGYAQATDIVKQTMCYRLFSELEDPATVMKECADELRSVMASQEE